MNDRMVEYVMRQILDSGAIEIRDVDGGEDAFLYSSGNHGPGYVDIKGRCGFSYVFKPMSMLTAVKLIEDGVEPELIVGMMTGGSIPGFRIHQILSDFYGMDIPYIYQRGARKQGGHGELDTGDRKNSNIPDGAEALIFEELVNFAQTTVNGAVYEREQKGRTVTDAGCILFYENPVAIRRLERAGITLHYPISLPQILRFGSDTQLLDSVRVDMYFSFLEDPKYWNESRGFPFFAEEE